MGCWMGALGRLTIVPEPDNDLIMEYVDFSKSACPKEYKEDEVFHNSWYFDENNRLASGIGKFAEPSVWYGYLKNNRRILVFLNMSLQINSQAKNDELWNLYTD